MMRRLDAIRLGGAAAMYAASTAVPAAAAAGSGSHKLEPPVGRPIAVGFLISHDATVIDFTGPWEVFNEITVPTSRLWRNGKDYGDATWTPFKRFTIAEKPQPLRVAGGMQIVPDYTIANAPHTDIIVIGAQEQPTPAGLQWLRDRYAAGTFLMSICVGAFALAATGLLDGLLATTHHDAYARFAKKFPKVRLMRDVRYVEYPTIASAGGLSSGIDLALRVVERYYGEEERKFVAEYMEYQPSSLRPYIAD